MTPSAVSLQLIWQLLPNIVALCAIAYFGHTLILRRNASAQRKRIACVVVSDFYAAADEVLADPASPDIVRKAIFALMQAVTDNRLGRKLTRKLIDHAENYDPRQSGKVLTKMIDKLRESRPDLAENIELAFRTGFNALILEHGHSDARVSIIIETSKNRSLFSWAESIAAKLRDDGRGGPDGHTVPI